jgi:hypothetical protein
MILKHGLHLAYCTNIHRGETWRETFDSLKNHALAVREIVCPRAPFAIGLRLSQRAATTLSHPATLLKFQRWLDTHDCYIFTINGFPYGRFHGARVKEQVYAPDWTSPARLAYTNLLFDLLAQLVPAGIEGSVSTLPGSFKEFIRSPAQLRAIRQNLWRCVQHIGRTSKRARRKLHLGLEPEPLGLFENSRETVAFFEQLRAEHSADSRLDEFLGVNYDTCHFAIEFEEPKKSFNTLLQAGIKISKIHLSSALKTKPTNSALTKLKHFAEPVYLHQVIARGQDGQLIYYRDLPDALQRARATPVTRRGTEWRIHFHVPLHAPVIKPFQNTNHHLTGVLDLLAENPKLCSHLEMETYTWEVLPAKWKAPTVNEQLAAEYQWTLKQLAKRGLAAPQKGRSSAVRRPS